MAAGDLVVLPGQRPVDAFGTPTRHGDRHGAAAAKHPCQFGHSSDVVGDVLEDLRTDHAVEGLVGTTNDKNFLVRQYHRLLVWDIMKHPALTRYLEAALNPLVGKSLVVYLQKPVA